MEHLKKKKGVFLTIDVAIALILLIFIVSLPLLFYHQSSSDDFNSQLLRAYIQDAATVAEAKGCLSSSLDQSNSSATSGLRDVLLATPDAVCAQVAAYGAIVPEGLIGHWKLDEGTGVSAIDSSGLGNDGVIEGSPQYADSGRAGKALFFNGETKVSTPIGEPLYDFTVSAWFKDDKEATQNERILDKSGGGTGFWLGRDDTNSEGWGGMIFDQKLTTTLSSGQWHHIVLVRNGADAFLYGDGVEVSTATVSTEPDKDLFFTIGGIGAEKPSDAWMTGMIDDVRLYNRSLTQEEVLLLYNNPSGLYYVIDKPGCVAAPGGEVQALSVPFVDAANQDQNDYYTAIFKMWFKGAGR